MSTDKQSIDWYNDNAEEYTAHVRNRMDSVYHSYYEKPSMYSLVPEIKNKSVLSLGCGSGEDSSYLKKLGAAKSVGIDISSQLIKIAIESHPECQFEVMDMEHLNFPDSSFDFIYSSLAIHYLENWTHVFKEAYRILKPNSFVLFSCNHPVRFAMASADSDTDWISKLEIAKNKKTGETTIMGDYISKIRLEFSLGKNFGKDPVITWRKSFGEISSELSAAGFLIEKILDPKPGRELEKIKPGAYKKLMKIPEFAIFRLLKI